MGVAIPFAIEVLEPETKETSKTYALDLDKGRIFGMVDDIMAVRQFIKKAILTCRFHCLIYDSDYGSELHDLIRCTDASEAYIEEEIPRMISDALLVDERILDVGDCDLAYDLEKDEVQVRFYVETIFGEMKIEEVIT